MNYHLLCLPPIGLMTLAKLRETLAYLQAIEDPDWNVDHAIERVKKQIIVRQAEPENPGISSAP